MCHLFMQLNRAGGKYHVNLNADLKCIKIAKTEKYEQVNRIHGKITYFAPAYF